MKKKTKELLWHLLVIVFFVIFSFAYFNQTLDNKTIRQGDFEHSKAIGHEAGTYSQAEHRDITWTNSIFGGMPTYQIGGFKMYNIFYPIGLALTHTMPYGTVSSLFLYLLGFYILLLTFKINPFLSTMGAIAFALSSYNIIIIAAGHISKTYAIAYMPIILAGIFQIYNKKYYLGFILTTIGLGLQLLTGHIQIIYYTALMIGIFAIFRLVWDLREKQLKQFGVATLFALVAAFGAVVPNIGQLWRASEMSKYSIRGKSELTTTNKNDNKKQSTGLDEDYAMSWSYGIGESWSLLIPNVKGGESEYLGNDKTAMKNVDSQYTQYISQQNHYWGDQPFTSGPVYFGAIIMFLFVLGMFIVKDKIKWWLLAITIISIVLSWGKNFEFFTNFMFYYFPYYNKFRSVSMTLVMASFSVPLLAILAVNEIVKDKEIVKKNMKYVWISLGLTAGIALIFWLIPGFFKFQSAEETKYFNDLFKQVPADQHSQINTFLAQLQSARKEIFKADAIRTFIFIVLSAAVMLFYTLKNNLNKNIFLLLITVLVTLDLWTVDRRYLGDDDFMSKRNAEGVFAKSPADEIILKDKDPYYRVLDVTSNPFSNAFTSYWHKSIGGYHGAKLHRYQDIIDYYLTPEFDMLIQSFKDSLANPMDVLPKLQVMNMLNTKYIIYNPNAFPLVNVNAYGNAWFIDNFKYVSTPDEEIQSLGNVNLKRTAVINKTKFDVSKIASLPLTSDTLRTIELTNYEPDKLKFKIQSQNGGFVVFSDIYYPGWIAEIEGKQVPIYQTDYILRGIYVPAGIHFIQFEFHPAAFYTAKKIEIISSIIVALLLIGALYMELKNSKKTEEQQTSK